MRKNIFTRKYNFSVLVFVIFVFLFSSVSNAAANTNDKKVNKESFQLNIKGKQVEFKIESKARGKVTEQMLEDLSKENPSINNFIIYEIGAKETGEKQAALADPTVSTYKTVKSKDVLAKDAFVTSVARGQTYSFSSSKTFKLTCTISGDTPYGNLSLTPEKSVTYTKSYTFNGPSETSSYNSRVYKCKFFQDIGTWKQRCIDKTTQKLMVSA